MTDTEKKALIKKLGAKSNPDFDARYSEENRKWFVGKTIDLLISKSTPDADIERLAKAFIVKAGTELKPRIKRGVSDASLKDKWAALDQLTSRTQIIYDLFGLHPDFFLPANAGYFDFILERRFRSIQRMAFFVNPNDERNRFAYPSSGGKMKLNKDTGGSAPIWFPISGNAPFILTGEGKKNPDAAIETLFNVNTGSDRNLLFCDPTATVLHMDALRAAKDSNKLLTALIANGDQYLKVDHPDGHSGNFSDGQALVGFTSAQATAGNQAEIKLSHIGQVLTLAEKQLTAGALTTDSFVSFPPLAFTIVKDGAHEIFQTDQVNPVRRSIKTVGALKNTFAAGAKVYLTKGNHSVINTLPHHFISDSRPDHALFEQLTVKSTELQVGDHVYVLNHPIYKKFYPSGIWGGEHSFIAEIASRDNTSSVFRNAVKLGGHGLPNTSLLGMIDEMLKHNNLVLAILQSLTTIHLGNLKKNGRPTADATVDKNGFKFNFIKRKEGAIDMNVFVYNMPYDYSYIISGKPKTFKLATGFVIKEKASSPDSSFQIWQNDGIDFVTPPPLELRVNFIGSTAAEQFMLSKWSFGPFLNSQTVSFDKQPLFKSDNKTPNLLTFDDIVKSKPLFVTDDSGDAFVTRPRVDFRAPYQTFLKNNGAI